MLVVHVFVGLAVYHNAKKAIAVLIALVLCYIYAIYTFILVPFISGKKEEIEWIEQKWNEIINFKVKGIPVLKRFVNFNIKSSLYFRGIFGILLLGFFVWLILDTAGKRIRLRSLIGYVVFLLICFFCSANPYRIKWRPVIGGIILQFIVGLLVLRWSVGNEVIKFISHNVS